MIHRPFQHESKPTTRLSLRALLVVAAAWLPVSALLHAEPVKIMPLGDSLTRGNNDINFPNGDIPGGYRKQLGILLASEGVTHDFVGGRNDLSAPGMDPDHEGHPGFRTDEILASLPAWLATAPDQVLLMVGTNDVLQDVPTATAAANLSQIMVQITNGAPARQLFVATIPPIQQAWPPQNPTYTAAYLNSKADSYNGELRELVQQHAAAGRNVTLVDMNELIVLTDFDPQNSYYQPGDGIHPGQAGYNQLGELWFAAIAAGPPLEGLPEPPGGLSVIVASPSRVNLTWTDQASDETGYEIRCRTGTDGAWETIATLPADSTSHAVTGLATGVDAHGFAVRAVNGIGPSTWTPTVFTPTPEDLAHLKPATASSTYNNLPQYAPPRANDDNTNTLWSSAGDTAAHWQVDVGDPKHLQRVTLITRQDTSNVENQRKNFEIRASNDPGFESYVVLGSVGNTPIEYKGSYVLDVPGSAAFKYVRAAKTDGQSFSIGLLKVHGADQVAIPAAPADLTAEASVQPAGIRLNWDVGSDNETGFKLERKSGANGTYVQIAGLPAATSTWLDADVVGGGSYHYRIRATNESGDSPFSNEATAAITSSSYDAWAANYPDFLALSPEEQAPDADPNDDGIDNLLAYSMAVDPLQPAPLPIIQLTALSPVAAIFRFRRNHEAPDLMHEVLVSEDPSAGEWESICLAGALTSEPGGIPAAQWVEVLLPNPVSGGKLFARLRVTRFSADE